MIKYTCKHYVVDGGCPPETPNVHCAAPLCRILTADSTPEIDLAEALEDLQLALVLQDVEKIDIANNYLQRANKAMDEKKRGLVAR